LGHRSSRFTLPAARLRLKAITRTAVNRLRLRAHSRAVEPIFAKAKSLQERVSQQFVRTEPGVVAVDYGKDHQFVHLKFIGNA
jgi:hypothetical protein